VKNARSHVQYKLELILMVRVAEILFKDRPAGRLEETAGGGTRFAYDPAWSEQIACCFPVARREYEWQTGLHPFFQHLGPEGWLREKQARAAHVVDEDDFGLLLRYGADCIGAVGVRGPESLLEPERLQDPATEAATRGHRTVSGVQKKLLVVKDKAKQTYRPALSSGPAPYIAKFNSETIPTLVRNEFLSLRWAAAVLGADEVNAFELGTVLELNESALVVKRFDRTAGNAKLRLEDCAQILGKPRGNDYAGKYDASYEDVAQVIQNHSVRPEIDLARFFNRVVAYAVIGNCDAHLKNFSLLETEAGLRLSPAYDILNTALYSDYSQRFALAIGGDWIQLEAIERPLLEAFGQRIGLPPAAIALAFQQLRTRAKRAEPLLNPPGGEGPEGLVSRFGEIVSRGCLRILNG
jgi:serine/threonine-protein kinase HipA